LVLLHQHPEGRRVAGKGCFDQLLVIHRQPYNFRRPGTPKVPSMSRSSPAQAGGLKTYHPGRQRACQFFAFRAESHAGAPFHDGAAARGHTTTRGRWSR
jgi:hypothetical protein